MCRLSDSDLIAEIFGLFLGGWGSSRTSVAWTALLLAQHPKVAHVNYLGHLKAGDPRADVRHELADAMGAHTPIRARAARRARRLGDHGNLRGAGRHGRLATRQQRRTPEPHETAECRHAAGDVVVHSGKPILFDHADELADRVGPLRF